MTKEIENKYGVKVGTPVTFGCWTDRYPGVVTRVSAARIYVKRVATGPNKEQWPAQDWEVYLDQPEGNEIPFTKTAKGWRGKGYSAALGHARKYEDPSF